MKNRMSARLIRDTLTFFIGPPNVEGVSRLNLGNFSTDRPWIWSCRYNGQEPAAVIRYLIRYLANREEVNRRTMDFKLRSDYQPRGDQAVAIEQLLRGVKDGEKHQVLLGVTGSGKTFTMAKVVEAVNRTTLVLAHNKTLAAQLYHEFRNFFPDNAVEYFVSYYDYYQPEAYVPAGDVYIEKEATINDELDKLRMSATRSLFERRDCIIVASVSCIYGLGSPEAYYGMLFMLEKGQKITRKEIMSRLVDILYDRNDHDFKRGTFRVRGDVIEVYPTYEDLAYRIELWGDEVENLSQIDPLLGQVTQTYHRLPIYPRSEERRVGKEW